jgi:RNA polymerase sigma-70 factor (ECF subfamily)
MGLLRNRLDQDAHSPVDHGEAEADLVAQARTGNGHAFTLLYRRHVVAVYRYGLVRLRNREDAEDATQTTFLRAAQSLDQCRSDDAFLGWLFAIASNVITDMQRRRNHPTVALVDDLGVEDPDAHPDELAVRAMQRAELREARARCLNEADRQFFDLLLADLTYAEMAVALDKRIGSIRTRHWRLLERLRKCLEPIPMRNGGAL